MAREYKPEVMCFDSVVAALDGSASHELVAAAIFSLLCLSDFILVNPRLFIFRSPPFLAETAFDLWSVSLKQHLGRLRQFCTFLKNGLEALEYGSPLRQFFIFKISV